MKNAITKKINFDLSLLPIIQNLAQLGKSEADIGLIIGYSGRKPGKFLEQLKKDCPDVAIALEVGRRLADTELVTTAFEAAVGYDYTEETKDFKMVRTYDEETGDLISEDKVLMKHKKMKKHQRPDSAILRMLLVSRLPDYFIDSKKMVLNVGDTEATEEEVARFFGKFYELAKKHNTKVIEAEVIDVK